MSDEPNNGAVTLDDVTSFIFNANRDEMNTILDVYKRRRTQLREQAVCTLQPGTKVTWEHKGKDWTGTVTKQMKTRVKVKREDGQLWNIPPSCLTVIQ